MKQGASKGAPKRHTRASGQRVAVGMPFVHRMALALTPNGALILSAIGCAVTLCVYFGLVFDASWYRAFALIFVNELALLPIAGAGLFAIFFADFVRTRVPARVREFLSGVALAAAIIAFTLPLAQTWAVGHPLDKDGQMWAGLIPIADNYFYWSGLHHLEAGHELGVIGSRRPLNAAYFMLRHVVSGGSLQIDLILQAVVLGAACYFAAREVSANFGRIAGLFSFLTLYDYAITWIPSTMTECLGLTLGAGAFAFIIRGWAHRKLMLFVMGMVLLSVGQTVRGGAFLVLPLIALASTVRFGDHTKDRLRSAFVVVIAIAIGFLPARILYQQYGDTTSGALNGGVVGYVYGMSMGGTGFWSGNDYLKANGFDTRSEKEQDEILRARTLVQIRAHPGMLLRGIAHEYLRYFNSYSFPLGPWRLITAMAGLSGPVTEVFCSVFLLIGLVTCAVRRIWSLLALIIACWLGIALSVPLLAEMERRLFAVTVPATALMGAVGVSLLLGAISRRVPTYREKAPAQLLTGPEKRACLIVAAFIALTTLTPAMVAMAYNPRLPQISCSDGLSPRIVRTVSGASFVFLHRDEELAASSVPHVRESDYRGNFKLPYFSGLPAFMRELRPGQFLSAEMTWLPRCCIDSWRFYVGDRSMISKDRNWSYWCVENKDDYAIVRSKATVLSPEQGRL